MRRRTNQHEVSVARDEGTPLELVKAEVVRGHRVGRLVGWNGGPCVDYPGNPHGPLAARAIPLLDAVQVASLPDTARDVLLTFESERSDRPVIVGLLQPAALSLAPTAAPLAEEVRVDGRRIVLEGQDEVVLRCGKASITLRSNGRLVVRGAYVETASEGVHRIKGAAVRIN